MAADPYKIVVDGYLADFQGGVALLHTPLSDREHNEAAERLCRLSRDITFSLGRPTDYDQRYIRRIAALFDEAASLIRETNADVIAFRNHIRHRATVMRDELKVCV